MNGSVRAEIKRKKKGGGKGRRNNDAETKHVTKTLQDFCLLLLLFRDALDQNAYEIPMSMKYCCL